MSYSCDVRRYFVIKLVENTRMFLVLEERSEKKKKT